MKWMAGLIAGAIMVFSSASAFPLPIFVYVATLDGASEATPNASVGTGWSQVTPYPGTDWWRIQVNFSGLSGVTTASHIHCCTAVAMTGAASVATPTPYFPGFPLGVTSGMYDQLFDMSLPSSYNGSFLAAFGGNTAAAEAALLAGLQNGTAYVNVHSDLYPGGEIRGFYETVVIDRFPEPATLALLGAGMIGVFGLRRRKRAA